MGLLQHPGPERSGGQGRVDGLGSLDGDGAGASAGQSGALQIRPLQIGPGQTGHEGVSRSGGIDRLRRSTRQKQALPVVRRKDAVFAYV